MQIQNITSSSSWNHMLFFYLTNSSLLQPSVMVGNFPISWGECLIPSFHLRSCTVSKSNLKFVTSLATAFKEPGFRTLLEFHVHFLFPYFLPESVHVPSPAQNFVTSLFIYIYIFFLLWEVVSSLFNLRTEDNPCRLFLTAHREHSLSDFLFLEGKLRTRWPWFWQGSRMKNMSLANTQEVLLKVEDHQFLFRTFSSPKRSLGVP